MEEADWLVDFGPGAGELGGEVVAQGTPPEVMKAERSLTGAYLSGRRKIEIPSQRRRGSGKSIKLMGAAENNLKDLDVEFPLGCLVAVSGVSGAGKSTLVNRILYPALARAIYGSREAPGAYKALSGIEHLDKVIEIDQKPIGRTPRSNPATYTKVFDCIRDVFARTPEARAYGYEPGRFSFNVKGGRCEACEGDGLKVVEMHFLADVYVPCEVCHGKRFNDATLRVTFKGKNIAEVLDMSVREAMEHFSVHKEIIRILKTLDDVGLGYIKIGQPSPTLSGGEAQRIKLSRELARTDTGRTLYVLDEPTTGLHFEDIKRLLSVLNRLVDAGNTVLVIEHNLDVIKCADWIVDMGPEGGDKGGRVVATGTPEQVAQTQGQLHRPIPGQSARPRPRRLRQLTESRGHDTRFFSCAGLRTRLSTAALPSSAWAFPAPRTARGSGAARGAPAAPGPSPARHLPWTAEASAPPPRVPSRLAARRHPAPVPPTRRAGLPSPRPSASFSRRAGRGAALPGAPASPGAGPAGPHAAPPAARGSAGASPRAGPASSAPSGACSRAAAGAPRDCSPSPGEARGGSSACFSGERRRNSCQRCRTCSRWSGGICWKRR